MTNNFYALLDDFSIRKILLTQNVTTRIRNIFVELGELFLNDDTEEVEFDGNYIVGDDEILFVNLVLGENFSDVENNSIAIQALDLSRDRLKALFWYENQKYYFQNFDNRKLLRNKNVLIYNNDTYSALEENAFIVDNVVNAMYIGGKFYFKSYVNANKIFSLTSYYQAATEEDIKSFCENDNISVDESWLISNSTTTIRKQITLIQKSGVLKNADAKKIKRTAKGFDLNITIDSAGKIILPNNKKECKELLVFLNEQYFIGLITGNKYKTNSKKNA